jgi:putative flippase GtrA
MLNCLFKKISLKYSKFYNNKIISFLLIGGFTFIIYYAILWFCFSFASLPYVGSIAIAYSAAIFFHFLANQRVTFNSEGSELWQQLLRYLVLALINYAIQLGVARVLYEIFKMNFYAATFFGVLSTMVSGYFLMKAWVFRKMKI